jgi:hypothetical protein
VLELQLNDSKPNPEPNHTPRQLPSCVYLGWCHKLIIPENDVLLNAAQRKQICQCFQCTPAASSIQLGQRADSQQ